MKLKRKVTFMKNNVGSTTAKLVLPKELVDSIGLTATDNYVHIDLVDNKIVIEPATASKDAVG